LQGKLVLFFGSDSSNEKGLAASQITIFKKSAQNGCSMRATESWSNHQILRRRIDFHLHSGLCQMGR
jgi:hypothetical protein